MKNGDECIACGGVYKTCKCWGCDSDFLSTYEMATMCPDCGEYTESLLPPLAIAEVQKVLEFGAEKYSPWGWRTANTNEDDMEAAERHSDFWQNGGNHDHESNLNPLAHAIARLMFILDRDLEANK